MKLKTKPQDFIVEEMLQLPLDEKGKYAYYKLKKTNTETQKAIQIIANAFNCSKKLINLAGTKDKVAITTQCISINDGPGKDYKDDNVELTYVGRGRERLRLGMLDGNKFTIVVRNISKEEMTTLEKNKQNIVVPNYYDDQRFGILKNNHIIGRHILKREFKQAVEETIKQDHFPNNLVAKYIEKKPTDFIGAMRTLPKNILTMFLYAYQSYLWNETVKIIIAKNPHKKATYALGELLFPEEMLPNRMIPLIGFDLECEDQEVQAALEQIMQQEGIKTRDFLIRQMPELSAAGGSRPLYSDVKEFTLDILDQETIKASFSLGKGSYATVVIKALFAK